MVRRLEKPKLWDVFLAPSASAEWVNIVPVAGRAAALSSEKPASTPEAKTSRLHSWFPYFRPRPSARIASASPSDEPQGTSPQDWLAELRAVQITLLVAMPSPYRNAEAATQAMSPKGKEKTLSGYWDDEDGVPDVVLGVTQVRYRDGDDKGLEHVAISTTTNYPSVLSA